MHLRKMKKILSIFGTRPQFIKLQPLSKAIEDFNKDNNCFFKHIVVNTGQHFDKMLSDIFIEELEIKEPDYNLGVKEKSHCRQIGRMIIDLERVLDKERPDIVLVYGDTNSTLSGAITAKKMGLKVAHIEAGLRSFDREMPEEINRIIVDKISDVLFCPTANALKNLKNEGFFLTENDYRVFNVGDVMLDSFLLFSDKVTERTPVAIKRIIGSNRNFILVTIHRAANTDNSARLKKIMEILSKISRQKFIVFPIHPRTRKKIKDINNFNLDKIKIIEPVSYFDMLSLEKNVDLIMTDSGGVQKEAYFFNKPCITLRKETEWLETLGGSCNNLVDLDCGKILKLLDVKISKKYFKTKQFGEGKASKKIVDILADLI